MPNFPLVTNSNLGPFIGAFKDIAAPLPRKNATPLFYGKSANEFCYHPKHAVQSYELGYFKRVTTEIIIA